MIRPALEGDEGHAPSIKFPVRTILRLEVGKTKSSVLGRSIYDHIHPMTCFSIVVKLWTEAETYFDFEASSVFEREALISTLMVVLDQMHNNNSNSTVSSSSPAWMHPKSTATSGTSSVAENTTPATRTHAVNKNLTAEQEEEEKAVLSPGKRTKIFNSPFFEDQPEGEDQQGTEISLVYSSKNNGDDDAEMKRESSTPKKPRYRHQKSKPLRQRQLQPAAAEADEDHPHPLSPPRTPRMRYSPSRFASASKPTFMNLTKGAFVSAPQSPHHTPLDVVVVNHQKQQQQDDDDLDTPISVAAPQRGQGQDDFRDAPEDGGIVILDSNNPNQPATEIELGLESDGIRQDESFELSNQGLPVSKIQFTPTRDFSDPRSGCCSFTLNGVGSGADDGQQQQQNQNNQQQIAWCSDDICTLALKDIAETCTGIFPAEHNKDVKPGDEAAAERIFVEEYIACALGGPDGALGVFFPNGDVWNIDTSKQASQAKNDNGANRIRNRASLLNAQAVRLRQLRNEMTFAAALKRSKEKMHYVQTTKSFDDADMERLRQAQERSVNRLHSSALMERVMGSMVLAKHEEEEEEAVYYDSDPEDVRQRTRGGVRRAVANRHNAVTKEEEAQHQARPILSGVGFERIAVGKKLRKLDEGLIIQIVQVKYFFLCYRLLRALMYVQA
jgi:hypothetical protein